MQLFWHIYNRTAVIFLLTISDVQEATDSFYCAVYSLLDNYYPLTTITTTNKDPSFVTPYIKQLLRKKNKLMKRGRTSEAESLQHQIRTQIVKSNSSTFKNISSRSCARDMWAKVREITGKSRLMQAQAPSFGSNPSADEFNQHYSNLSTDKNYQQSNLKITVNNLDSLTLIVNIVYSKCWTRLNLQPQGLMMCHIGS